MKERGMLFTSDMVRAIQEDRKTMTRRVVKRQPGTGIEDCYSRPDGLFMWLHLPRGRGVGIGLPFKCPYGVVGDRLYVREHWGYSGCSHSGIKGNHAEVVYHADDTRRKIRFDNFDSMMKATPNQNIKHPDNFDSLEESDRDDIHSELISKWWKRKQSIPSIHMPKWAARIWLEITGVRVERLQEMSSIDALAEGMRGNDRFHKIWDACNPRYLSQDNPWVWTITFKRLTEE